MDGSERIERRAAAWLARRDGPDWDAQAQAAFDAWLAQATAHRVAALRLEAAWRESARLQALAAGGTAAHRAGASRYAAAATGTRAGAGGGALEPASLVFAPRTAAPRRRRLPVPVAAALAAMLALVAWWWIPGTGRPPEPARYSTPTGTIRPLALADGSQALLSSDSAISVRLGPDERDVALDRGEAFFQVSRDPDRPFVVSAGTHEVVAVGTRFAVRRDPAGLRVVVTEGTVRLQADRAGSGQRQPTALLPAGSIALAGPNGVLVRTGSVRQAEDALSWREGLLSFRDTPLAAAAAEFNRYNVRKLVIADPGVGALRIGGSFKWSNAEAFVRLLERGFPVRAEYRDDRIELHGR